MSHHQILGIYADPAQAAQAIAAVQKEDLGQVVAYSPVQHHAIERVLRVEGSRVGLFTLVGGLLGGFSGFALPIYTSLEWALITGGKPVIAIPAFTVIAFELTILFAALGGVARVSNPGRAATLSGNRSIRRAVHSRSVRGLGRLHAGTSRGSHCRPGKVRR